MFGAGSTTSGTNWTDGVMQVLRTLTIKIDAMQARATLTNRVLMTREAASRPRAVTANAFHNYGLTESIFTVLARLF